MRTKLVRDYGNEILEFFKIKYSPNLNEKKNLLINEGLIPLTIKDLIMYKIKAIQSRDQDERNFWFDNQFCTLDGLVHYDGKLIVIPQSELLINSKLNKDNSLMLYEEQFDELSRKYEVLRKKNLILDKKLNKKQANEHPIWLALLNQDKVLLNEYVDLIFKENRHWNNEYRNMGIFLKEDGERPLMYPWVFDLWLSSDIMAGYSQGKLFIIGKYTPNLDELLRRMKLLKDLKGTYGNKDINNLVKCIEEAPILLPENGEYHYEKKDRQSMFTELIPE